MSGSVPSARRRAAAPRRSVVLSLLGLLCAGVAAAAPRLPAQEPWRQYADPAEVGFDPAALEAVCAYADSVRSGAFMAVWRGHVIVACGDVDRELEAHSVRKSLVSGLYGTAVARGEIDLDATLGELGIHDDPGLTDREKRATVRDVIAARSGVYLPAAYAPSSQDRERPERGSHPPGTHWFYNNWDFNVAGVIYERETGEDLYESFGRRIADPVGMEDWDPADGFRAYEPGHSRHPAHTFRISARDLARFGQLYLREGRWNGEQVVPASWIRESTRPRSDFGNGTGYGYMWWTYAAGSLGEDYPHLNGHALYMGRGTGGQGVWVVPGAELVAVHRGDTDHGREIAGRDAWRMVEGVLAARSEDTRSRESASPDDPALEPLSPRPLESQLPAEDPPEYSPLPEGTVEEYLGAYRLGPDAVVRVFLFEGRPYMHVPGEGDALLIPVEEDVFTIRVVTGVEIEFLRDDAGRVERVRLTLGSRTLEAGRVEVGEAGPRLDPADPGPEKMFASRTSFPSAGRRRPATVAPRPGDEPYNPMPGSVL